ncbi:MAG: Hsp20 family protein [Halieaceae bacterium]|nr:Hsp20 family protein [Halieaceae bacterium]
MRTSLDLSPLYRSAIGFDRMARLLDAAATDSKPSYPPYNVELVEENRYRISMAVAGFSQDDLEITSEQNTLTVAGKQADSAERKYLYQGIAERNFERKFQLDEHVHVIDARLENGLLHIELERELPEAMKPRKIAISDGNNGNLLEQDAA